MTNHKCKGLHTWKMSLSLLIIVIQMALSAIWWDFANGSGNDGTLPAINIISGVRGSTVELPCKINTKVTAVYWYRYSFLGDTDANNAERLVYKLENDVVNDAGPRFSLTQTYSLVIENVSVEDENTYSCHAALETGGGYDSYINLTVIVLAQPLHPTVDYCTPTREGVCIYTLAESIEDSETFTIICRVNMVRPAVRLSWNITEGGTNLMEEKQKEEGLWNVSLSIKVSKYEVLSNLTCLAEGSAVNGSSEITALIEHYHQGTPESITVDATAGVADKPSVKDFSLSLVFSTIAILAVVTVATFLLTLYHGRKITELSKRLIELEDNFEIEDGVFPTSGMEQLRPGLKTKIAASACPEPG